MKNLTAFLFPLSVLFLFSCSKNNAIAPSIPIKPAYIKDTGTLQFKLLPLAANDAKLLFYYPQSRNLQNVLLKKDTVTVGTFAVTNNNNSLYSAEINYAFDSTAQYTIQVQTNVVGDTIYRYTLPKYTPIYKTAYRYQKILSLNQGLGPNGFDISPSHNYLFIIDDSLNTLITKRISLQTNAVDIINIGSYLFPIRAVSDTELLVKYSFYNNRYLGNDSAALLRYNINTKQTQFIDWVSLSYGRISRVKNNRVLITHPFTTGLVTSLVNLTDGSKINYTSDLVNFTQIREDNFDNIYNANLLVNPLTGGFVSLLPNGSSDGVEYFDSSSQYTISSNYLIRTNYQANTINYTSYLSVYNNQLKIYQGDSLSGRSFYVPRAQTIKNNNFLFYQYFPYDTAYHTDGYYNLNLSTQKASLVQSDNSSPYIINDFLFDDTHLLSVRYDGVYLLVKN